MTKFKIGDEVRILKPRASRYNQFPEDGFAGEVVKVGRKYATASYVEVFRYLNSDEEHRYERTVEFDMETGRERGVTTSGWGHYIRTAEMLERERRMSEAKTIIKEAGLEFRTYSEHKFTLVQIEALAGLVKTWEKDNSEES